MRLTVEYDPRPLSMLVVSDGLISLVHLVPDIRLFIPIAQDARVGSKRGSD